MSEEDNQLTEKNTWVTRNLSIIGLYYNICRGGEDPYRPLRYIGLIVLISTSYWVLSPFEHDRVILLEDSYASNITYRQAPIHAILGFNGTSIMKFDKNSIDSIYYTLAYTKFALQRSLQDVFQINDKNQLDDMIVRIISIPILACLALSLRRTIERRFRNWSSEI